MGKLTKFERRLLTALQMLTREQEWEVHILRVGIESKKRRKKNAKRKCEVNNAGTV